nr:mutS protein homolog 5-like isoform X1 [Leptinotarsa decemlineata]
MASTSDQSNATILFKLSRKPIIEDNYQNIEVDQENENECGETVKLLSIICKNGKIGAAYYDFQEQMLYAYEEMLDTSPKYPVTVNFFREIEPRFVLTSGSIADEFIKVLIDLATNESNTTTSDSIQTIPANFFLVPPREYSYDICKVMISQLKLPSIEDEPSETKRELYIRSLIDFDSRLSIQAIGTLVKYLEKNWTHFNIDKNDLQYLHISKVSRKDHVLIDNATFRALHIFSKRSHDASFKRGVPSSNREGLSIYKLFSMNCKSKGGLMCLRNMLLSPTNNIEVINKRLDFISFVLEPGNKEFVESLQDNMKQIGSDINVILTRIGHSRGTTRDWHVLYKTIHHTIHINELSSPYRVNSALLVDLYNSVSSDLIGIEQSIENGIDFNASQRRGRPIIKFGLDAALDAKKLRQQDIAKDITAAARFAANNLPEFLEECAVIYLPEMGHLIGIHEWEPGCNPEELQDLGFQFMFTIGGVIHYKNPMCVELDKRLGDINSEIIDHENRILRRLSGFILKYNNDIREPLKIIGLIDSLISMAITSAQNTYVRPMLNQNSYFEIEESRHPLMEHLLDHFQCNDFYSGGQYSHMKIITGPNGSGKSIYLKQIALVVFLAHIGSYVPAKRANISLLNTIHTRLQATESAAVRLSGFMIDVSQMTNALNNANPFSLILMDEFGKGTTGEDGICLLASALRYFLNMGTKCPHVLVSTHFQQIANYLPQTPLVQYMKMEHKKENGQFCYLFKISEGISKSYAITIAEAVGIDKDVIERAREILECLRNNQPLRPLERIRRRNNFDPDNLDQLNIPEADIIDE